MVATPIYSSISIQGFTDIFSYSSVCIIKAYKNQISSIITEISNPSTVSFRSSKASLSSPYPQRGMKDYVIH